jgi:hypothetical protein
MTPAKIDDKLERIVASLHHVKVSVDDAGAAALSVAVELAQLLDELRARLAALEANVTP